MNVFLVYNRRHLETLRMVAQSWTRHGWDVRLRMPRTRVRKRAVLMDARVVNFGLRPGQPRKISTFGKKGWQTARLVRFPSGKLDDILTCGRKC
jgi:hypothetical protein